MDLAYLTISQAHELLITKKIGAVELTKYYLEKMHTLDSKIHAVLTWCDESALEQAKKVDEKISRGEELGFLEGIPYTAKDMFLTRGIRTTAASHMLDNFVPPYSATVIEKLNAAGAILLAKVNQDEFAHGGSTENSAYHPTHNPWDLTRVPGGSSGGSAAAVAADYGIFSLGTDTGGSIRQPAAYCGVTGLKPTYGLVSRYGVVAMASSLDCIGPIARSAKDAAILLEIIACQDPKDSTTIKLDEHDFAKKSSSKLDSIKIGYHDAAGANEPIKGAIEIFNGLGANVQGYDNPFDAEKILATYYVLTPSEISSNLSRYDGIRYGYSDARATDLNETYVFSRGHGFGAEPKRRIMLGAYALSAGYYDAYYKKAMQVRTILRKQFEAIFAQHDLLIWPTTLSPAFKIGEKSDPIDMYKTDLLTVAANLAGIPAISIPAGVENGLPIGLQIMAPQGRDDLVLQAAHAFQQNSDWHQRRPQL